MCGGTGAQTQLQGEQLAAYQQAQQLTQEQYGNQQAIWGPMSQQFQTIFNQGPSQEGFSQSEENTLKAQTVEGTAENYSQAAKAVNENMAGESGSATLPTGAQEELKGQIATSASQEESREQTQVAEADYSQGYQDWLNAGQGLENIAAGESPTAYENAETGAGSAAGTTAEQIAQEENEWINPVVGAAGAVGSAVVGENPGGIFGA